MWEQQLHICDLNDRALRYIGERKKILNGNDTPIHKGVESIMDTMKQLQLSLMQRHEVISGILTPVDMIAISDTRSKLKSALVEITALNSRLVMRNNKLAFELSFMPPDMRQKIVLEKNARSKIVLEQRTNPHHLMPDTAKEVKYYFAKADMSDPNVAKLQRDETVTSVKELLDEVEDIMKMMGVASANDLKEYEEGEDVQETRTTPPAPRAQSTKGRRRREQTCA